MRDARKPRDNEPTAISIDEETERRELVAAGWEPVEREGQIVWRSPGSGHLYPQGVAIAMVREGAETEVPLEPEGGA